MEGKYTDKAKTKLCPINLDEKSFDEPSTGTLLVAIVNCVIPFENACRVRRTVFDAAKKVLINARDQFVDEHGKPAADTALQRAFTEEFPKIFRTTILQLGGQLRATVPQLLSAKMKGTLDPRTFTIATFALCGFANFSSIGIQIGGIGALAPEQRDQLAKFGIRAMLAGTMANLLSASIVGIWNI